MRSNVGREIEDIHDFFDALADIQTDIEIEVRRPLQVLLDPQCLSDDPSDNALLIKMALETLHDRHVTGLLSMCMTWLGSRAGDKALADMQRAEANLALSKENLDATLNRMKHETRLMERGIMPHQRDRVEINKDV